MDDPAFPHQQTPCTNCLYWLTYLLIANDEWDKVRTTYCTSCGSYRNRAVKGSRCSQSAIDKTRVITCSEREREREINSIRLITRSHYNLPFRYTAIDKLFTSCRRLINVKIYKYWIFLNNLKYTVRKWNGMIKRNRIVNGWNSFLILLSFYIKYKNSYFG